MKNFKITNQRWLIWRKIIILTPLIISEVRKKRKEKREIAEYYRRKREKREKSGKKIKSGWFLSA